MVDQKQLALLESGVEAWNQWRSDEASINVDLANADLRWACWKGVNFRFADLRGADLRGADLREVDLTGSDLRGVSARNVNLTCEPLWL